MKVLLDEMLPTGVVALLPGHDVTTVQQAGFKGLENGVLMRRAAESGYAVLLTVDAEVLRAVKIKAARAGKGDSEVIEEALRRDLGLDLLGRLWDAGSLTEEEAMSLAVEAQHSTRGPQP